MFLHSIFNKKMFRSTVAKKFALPSARTIPWKISGLVLLMLAVASCKKESEISKASESIQWIRVIDDTLTFSSEEQRYQSRNGKVVTDAQDNMYVYYYASDVDRSVLDKYDPQGTLVWKKTFESCKPHDMAFTADGTLILATSLTATVPNYLTLHSIKANGDVETKDDTLKHLFYSCSEVLSANLVPLADNSLLISGTWKTYVANSNFTFTDTLLFVMKHTPMLYKEWAQYFGFCVNCPYIVNLPGASGGTSAVFQTASGQYVFQFPFNVDENSSPAGHSILTGIVSDSGIADTSFIYNTSVYNRYGNGFLKDPYGDYVFHYSSPRVSGLASQSVPSGFVRIGQDAQLQDTIPIPLPYDHQVVSCTKGPAGFMLTAYKTGAATGGGYFSGSHTLFLKGGNDWQTTEKFTLQEFYSDYFFSHAAVSDGYVSMGRIQSFNGPVNKLILIKWKN